MKSIVLLSGPMAVGKTTLRDELVSSHGFDYLRTGAFLQAKAQREGRPADREGLQNLGDQLDEATDYRWIVDDVTVPALTVSDMKHWLVDAVRKERQVEHFRNLPDTVVLHVHLTAPEEVLFERYNERGKVVGKAIDEYVAACDHPNEKASRALIFIADVVLDTFKDDTVSNAERILAALSRRL